MADHDPAAAERAAFEAAILAMPGGEPSLLRRRDAPGCARPGEYVYHTIQIGWMCWQEARATLAAPKAEVWQPIETAPKDGTVVLLARDMGDFGFVRGFGHFDGEPGSFLSGWITQGFDPVTSNLGLAHPTLWQPLPRRPAPPTSPAPQEESHD